MYGTALQGCGTHCCQKRAPDSLDLVLHPKLFLQLLGTARISSILNHGAMAQVLILLFRERNGCRIAGIFLYSGF